MTGFIFLPTLPVVVAIAGEAAAQGTPFSSLKKAHHLRLPSAATGASSGEIGWRQPTDASISTADAGMVELSDYLTEKGVTRFEGWRLIGAAAMTPDGKVIAGSGSNPDGFGEGWVVHFALKGEGRTR